MNDHNLQKLIDKYDAYFFHLESEDSYELVKGVGPLMVSAPHSVTQTREGKSKYAEPQTGVLACILNHELGCPIIYKAKNDGDANYDAESGYKDALKEYICSKDQIKFVLDLHQLSPKREIMIDIGTGKQRNLLSYQEVTQAAVESFADHIAGPIEVDALFPGSFRHTISSFSARECHVPALQIEMNSRLLIDEYKDYNFIGVLESLKTLIRRVWGKYGYKGESVAHRQQLRSQRKV